MGNAAHYITAKGGGLGDISASLIRYLYADGRFELHVVLPKYEAKIREMYHLGAKEMDALSPLLLEQGVHLVADSAFSQISEVYGDSQAHPRVQRAEAFQRYIINQLLDELRPDVVHCNDWMTGLVPAAARAKGIKSLFTLHNVFTELETPDNVDRNGINVRRFAPWLYFEQFPNDTPENWRTNHIDFTATGVFAANWVNTVSPTFLQEIVRGDFADVIPDPIRATVREKFAQGRALGVLNAPDDTIDPRHGKHITPYFVDDVMEKKKINKVDFQAAMGLKEDPNAPLFFWPSRLYPQKGADLLPSILPQLMRQHGVQLALVANGDPDIEKVFRQLGVKYAGNVAHRAFRADLSDLGKAAADFVLMPSRYEPCGLPQMECPRFGTLPVARLTGGLQDTVRELDIVQHHGNGFVFAPYTPAALHDAMLRAIAFYQQPAEVKQAHLQRIMRSSFSEFSLAKTATAYIGIYETMMAQT